jgi:hypothetical protein
MSFVVEELSIKQFDILPPDATHNDNPPPIADYFIRLFGYLARELCGQRRSRQRPRCHDKGIDRASVSFRHDRFWPIDTVTLMTDGSLEALDVLRIVGNGSTASSLNVRRDALPDVQHDPVWQEAFHASLNLAEVCRKCDFLDSCGGGHLAQCWSPERRFDNPIATAGSAFSDIFGSGSPRLWCSNSMYPCGRTSANDSPESVENASSGERLVQPIEHPQVAYAVTHRLAVEVRAIALRKGYQRLRRS